MSVKKMISTGKISERDLGKMVVTIVDGTRDENPTAQAIRNEYATFNKYDITSAVAFNSARKYSAAMLEDGRNVVMGAREFVPHKDSKIDKLCEEYEVKGNRILVIGLSKKPLQQGDALEDIEIIGVMVLEDHIRDDASENIEWFKNNGVSVRIITGDNPITASEIAKRAGIEGYDKYISLEGKTTDEVRHIARDYVIYGRVSPEQKEAIIQALKDDGHTVAMTGDGVNDILALRVADCSIAMASGSDAAKNVAHLVALDSNFGSLPDVVREGRRVINNLQRAFTIYLVKTVFAIVLTVVFLLWSLIGNGPAYPFETKNMYIWEMIYIGVGSLFLSLQPNEERIKSSFMTNILSKVLPAAFMQISMVLGLYLIAYVFRSSIINPGNVKDLAVFAFSIGSFIVLVRVCMPFDAYRTLLVIGLGFIGMIAFFADYHAGAWKSNIDKSIFGINYGVLGRGLINDKTAYALLFTVIAGILLYVLFEILAVKIHNKIDKMKEAAKYERY